MGIPDHLTCLMRNVYAGQEARVRTGRGTTDWFQTGKGVCQGSILSAVWLSNISHTKMDEEEKAFLSTKEISDLKFQVLVSL